MATKTNRLGETRMMNCGMEATIIRYGKYSDIDVRFEDGVIVEHKRYRAFENGNIANPNFNPRLGETKMMNCGMEATIIRYGGSADIDVRFEDGIVVEHREYREFEKGGIINPNIKATAENRLDETCMMNCGMKATIIRYNGVRDIDVRFEDGTVAEHKAYGPFKRGEIANPNIKTSAENCLGETRMMNCGMEATIIRYGGYKDIDVRFEDGTVVEHKGYSAFKRGEIANPNVKTFANRLDETRMMNCGMEATIIRYSRRDDIDVRFEDGTVIEHRQYNQFERGNIANPNFKASRLGETRMMNCGMEATIIRYSRRDDIDVRFEDGTVIEHRQYNQFERGNIANPNFKASRLGETRMMKCGMKATIIRYGKYTDIDVRFEDGTIIEHRQYIQFKKGGIANPNFKASAENCLGETRMMNCGMEATIIRYNTGKDIDVRFEDETVVEHRGYGNFKTGGITHPLISLNNGSKDFHGFICKRGFIDEDRTLYECICKHCGLEDVLTPQEMMEHEKSEHGEDK